MALLTLGTGVGGGIVLADELFVGPGGNAGEIGHTVIFPKPSGSLYDGAYHDELTCPCGSYGCLERLVSASAAKRRARAAGLTDDLPVLAQAARDAAAQGVHLLVTPELSLCGYPPEDLLLRSSMQLRIEQALQRLRDEVRGIYMVVGFPWQEDEQRFNACALIST